MIKVEITETPTTYKLSINGHANYGDAPAGDNETYKKVCACVTLVALSISQYCYSKEIEHDIDTGKLEVLISKDKYDTTLEAYVNQLFLLQNIHMSRYIMVELKKEN